MTISKAQLIALVAKKSGRKIKVLAKLSDAALIRAARKCGLLAKKATTRTKVKRRKVSKVHRARRQASAGRFGRIARNPVVLDPGGISYTGPFGPMGYLDKTRYPYARNPAAGPQQQTHVMDSRGHQVGIGSANHRFDAFRQMLDQYDGRKCNPAKKRKSSRTDVLPGWVAVSFGNHPVVEYVASIRGRGQKALALEMLQMFRGQRGSVPKGSDHGLSETAASKIRQKIWLLVQHHPLPQQRSNPHTYPSLAALRACEAVSRSNAKTKKAVIRIIRKADLKRSRKRK